MYATVCPKCRREYIDTIERLCILREGMCVECLADHLRWEEEGGPVEE
jgi:hypothetical protein